MRNQIFPYRTLSKDLMLSIDLIQLETFYEEKSHKQSLSEELIDYQAYQINLWKAEDQSWIKVHLNMQVQVPSGAVPNVDALSEEAQVTAIAICRKTHLRKSVNLKRTSKDGTLWQGIIDLDRHQAYEKVEVQCVLNGRALDRDSRYFAESNRWELYFGEAQRPGVHGSLPVIWVNFSTDPEFPHLREYADEAYFLDINRAEPTVYLNQELNGLRTVFQERPRPTGGHLALQEALTTSIAKSVWLSLFQTAVGNLEGYQNDDDVYWPTVQWQEDILKKLLAYIYPDRDEASMLAALTDDLQAANHGHINTLALALINREIIHEGQSLRRAIKQIDPLEA